MSRNGGNDEAKRSFRNSMITTCLQVDGDISGEDVKWQEILLGSRDLKKYTWMMLKYMNVYFMEER